MKWIVKLLAFSVLWLIFLMASPRIVEADEETKPKKNIVHPKDQSAMVLVSEGEFLMGLSQKGVERFLSDSIDYEIHKDETPQHKVFLDAYYIDQYEITVKQYAQFLKEIRNKELNPCCHLEEPARKNHTPNNWKTQLLEPNMPVVGVDWYDAYAYAKWAEKRLPTEAEWEKAARGTQGKAYPWGDDYPTSKHSNFFLNVGRYVQGGSYPKGVSPYSAYDMAGNVWEWVNDTYSARYYHYSEPRNPMGAPVGSQKCYRGGSFQTGPDELRSSFRSYNEATYRVDDLGFRCAKNL